MNPCDIWDLRDDRFLVVNWPEHWTNGGTAITKLSPPHDTEIAETVRLFGDSDIFIKGNELHSNQERVDLSDFWAFHRKRLGQKQP